MKKILLVLGILVSTSAISQNWIRVGSGLPSHFANANNEVIEFGGEMYTVGYVFNGTFNVPDAYTPKVFKLSSGVWSEVGSGFASSQTGSYTIKALAEYNSELYIGGNFIMNNGVDPAFNDVAKWDALNSRWVAVGDGTGDGTVNELTVFDGKLYAGGLFGDLGAAGTKNIAVWAGASWATVGTGMSIATPSNEDPDQISSMVVYNNELIVGGKFSTAGGELAHNIAKWNGTLWAYLKGDIVNGGGGVGGFNNGQVYVMSLQVFGSDLYIGGTFTTYYNISYIGSSTIVPNHLAVWNGSSFSAPTKATPANIRINAMTVFKDRIYIGNTNESNIYSWDGGIFDWRLEPDRDPIRQRVTSFYSNSTEIIYSQSYGLFTLADPEPSYTISSSQACTDTDVTFTDTSTGTNTITAWSWTFEGGAPATSSDQNPVVQYAAAGTFDVSLTVTSSDGSFTKTDLDAVSVSDNFAVEAGTPITLTYGDTHTLADGTPSGGSWSGPGLQTSNTEFNTFIDGPGEYTLTYSVTSGSCTATDELSVTVNKADWDIEFPVIPTDLVYPIATINLNGYPDMTYEVTAGVATIINGDSPRITSADAGSTTIKGTRIGDANHNETVIETTFSVSKGIQTITFSDISPNDREYNSTFILGNTATSNASLPVTYSILTGPATIDDNQNITVTGIGTVTVQADQAGNTNYTTAASVQKTFEAIKATQVITETVPDELSFSLSTYSFAEKVTSSAGLPVNLVVFASPGFFSGDNMDEYNFTATGQVTVSAFATGNDFYDSSLPVDIVFNVVKGNQVINFDGIDDTGNTSGVYTSVGFELNAETSSGLDISFEIAGGSGLGTLTGTKLDVTSAGSFRITSSQAGNDNWNAATSITTTISIDKAPQTITATEISGKLKSDDPFTLEASASSGLPLNVQSQTGRTSVSESIIAINAGISAGTESLVLIQQGNENYYQAETVFIEFCISPVAPVISVSGTGTSSIILISDNQVDANQWFLADGTSVGTGSTYNVLEAGVYTAIASSQDGCPQSAVSNEIAIIITSLNQELNEGIRIYPNPAASQLNIEIASDLGYEELELSILDLSGKLVSYPESRKTDRIIQVDVTGLHSGIYILQLRSESVIHQFRINKN